MKNLILSIILVSIFTTSAFATDLEDVDSPQKKSPAIAMLCSAVVPGSGEAYVGTKKRAITFLSLAAIGWGSFLYTGEKVDSYQTEYEELAYLHAGIEDPKFGYDDDFYSLLGRYESSDYYTTRVNPEYDGIEWDWTENPISTERWGDFQESKGNMKDTEKLQKGIKGGVIFLHALSALDALIAARLHNKKIDHLSFDIDWKESDNPTLKLSLNRKF